MYALTLVVSTAPYLSRYCCSSDPQACRVRRPHRPPVLHLCRGEHRSNVECSRHIQRSRRSVRSCEVCDIRDTNPHWRWIHGEYAVHMLKTVLMMRPDIPCLCRMGPHDTHRNCSPGYPSCADWYAYYCVCLSQRANSRLSVIGYYVSFSGTSPMDMRSTSEMLCADALAKAFFLLSLATNLLSTGKWMSQTYAIRLS